MELPIERQSHVPSGAPRVTLFWIVKTSVASVNCAMNYMYGVCQFKTSFCNSFKFVVKMV